MSAKAWRRLLAAIWVTTALLLGTSLWIQAYRFGALPGVSNTYVKFPAEVSLRFEPLGNGARLRIVAGPRSIAYAQGARTGDTVLFSLLSPQTRYRTIHQYWWPGETAVYPLYGRAQSIKLTAIASRISFDDAIANTGSVWTLLFAGFLFLRRPEAREVRLLGTMLCCLALGEQLEVQSFVTPWPLLDTAADVAGNAIVLAAAVLLARYCALFAVPASPLRRTAISATVAFAILAFAMRAVVDAQSWTAYPSETLISLNRISQAATYACSALAAALAIAAARGKDRERISWTVLPLYVFWIPQIVQYGITGAQYTVVVSNVGYFLAPVGLTYAVLNRRLLDIGFVINRAAVFTAVSLIIVGIFVLVEWSATELLGANARDNVILGAALALALGLSMRIIHNRVDLVLDHVFFRKRHEDEAAIREFAHEVGYITDLSVVLDRTVAVLEHRAHATGVALLLANAGRYGDVDENDEAVVSMRARHRPVDLHTLTTALHGDFAFPMVTRGELTGVLVLGPKRGGESYAPDEFDAITRLAQAAGNAIDTLRRKEPDRSIAILDAILELLQSISARMEQS